MRSVGAAAASTRLLARVAGQAMVRAPVRPTFLSITLIKSRSDLKAKQVLSLIAANDRLLDIFQHRVLSVPFRH